MLRAGRSGVRISARSRDYLLWNRPDPFWGTPTLISNG